MWYAYTITTVCFITLLMYRYSDQLLPRLRQYLFILNRINKFMDLRMNCLTPCFNQLYWDLCLFSSSVAISTSEALALSTRGSAVCIFFFLISPTPCTVNSWEKWLLHLAKILQKSITLLILYYMSSRLVTLRKVIDALYKSDIFGLTVSFKFINISFQIFIVFVPEMSTSFTSYIV